MRNIKEWAILGFAILMIGCGGEDNSAGAESRSLIFAPISVDDSNNREEYDIIRENIFKDVSTSPLSTFSADVDTASYSNVRRYLMVNEKLPPKDAVRIEEMLNYFNYNYSEPNSSKPFLMNKRVGQTVWNDKTKIIHIGLQTKKVDFSQLPASNLVFLIDVSGSMSSNNKLPLLKESIKLLVEKLREKDRVSIVVYSGSSGLVLDKARGDEKKKIIDSLNRLTAGGATAGGEGIELAYKVALESFIEDGNNRVILATDGDFNVGKSSQRELEELIEEKKESGVYLTVLGFGMGNLKDDKIETLADKGNGNYAYIDTLLEAKKVLVTEMGSTLYTVAKDVKIQVRFNPLNVNQYRLIGYENRRLENEEFADDNKDAGEVGMGHSVTVLYEIKPNTSNQNGGSSRYQDVTYNEEFKDELATISIRYKELNSSSSIEINSTIKVDDEQIDKQDFTFAQTVAGFGMILRDSKFKENLTIDKLINLVKTAKGEDKEGYRAEFIEMMKKANTL